MSIIYIWLALVLYTASLFATIYVWSKITDYIERKQHHKNNEKK